ncbi:zinc finger HIT domain-containing protein 3 [Neodiprion pinetum]|uniref:Zinc finger HIT domain-containing protein 3 n=1 Tax=Neodiprion lecontei TaxID=441921 RepID=A0A6J0CBE3_NEOLC|nr:zinc finger HIT domain-containing protein 3 [Neodiprion lecontei]XP_046425046.1 zinc finger HIT domain-containing protein 3 [Neodiprion fabricii]XP_046481354.1 zinc finger HIT domain-containing protein 3 [Neodiprion pinetum]
MTTCELCGKEIAPYKCPTCRIRYCSADCFKVHKSVPCTSQIPEPDEIKAERIEPLYRFPTEDTVSVEKLAALRQCTELKNCLNNPHVRAIMKGILDADDPTEAVAQAMTEPIFVELADACLRVVEPQDEVPFPNS